jgi:hypothetical protein
MKNIFSNQLLFLILVINARVEIMEHVRMCRVTQLVFVHHSLQDQHVKLIYLMVLVVVVCSDSLSRNCRVCT